VRKNLRNGFDRNPVSQRRRLWQTLDLLCLRDLTSRRSLSYGFCNRFSCHLLSWIFLFGRYGYINCRGSTSSLVCVLREFISTEYYWASSRDILQPLVVKRSYDRSAATSFFDFVFTRARLFLDFASTAAPHLIISLQ